MKRIGFFSRAINRSTVFALLFSLLPLTAIQVLIAPEAKAAVACAANDTSGNASGTNYTVSPSHGKVFYIDSGVNPRIDAAYAGYTVKSTTAKTNIWVKLSGFTGGQVSLSNINDQVQQIPSISAGASQTAYFLLKASGTTTTTDQVHTVTVYEGNPNRGGTSVYTCDFTFTDVRETIKASANKVQSVTVPSSNPTLGSLVSIIWTGGF